MGDRHRERICRVCPGNLYAGQQPRNHRMYLILAGIADADDRFLDQPCRIFADLDARARGIEQHDTARLPQLQCRLRVGVDEHLFDRRACRSVSKDEVRQRRIEREQAGRQRLLRVCLYLPISDVRQAIAIRRYQPPAGRAEARIETKDELGQPNFSITSSGTS